jgi:hypothetical protein
MSDKRVLNMFTAKIAKNFTGQYDAGDVYGYKQHCYWRSYWRSYWKVMERQMKKRHTPHGVMTV